MIVLFLNTLMTQFDVFLLSNQFFFMFSIHSLLGNTINCRLFVMMKPCWLRLCVTNGENQDQLTTLFQKSLTTLSSSITDEKWYESCVLNLWTKFKSYNIAVLEIKKVPRIPKTLVPRQANFPEFISQYFVYKILKTKLAKKNVVLNTTVSSADLLINGEIAEVKAGVIGPSTLTVQEKWDNIKYFYFLDCSRWSSSGVAFLYEIHWNEVKEELKYKYHTESDKKRRIKESFFVLSKSHGTLIWTGLLDTICETAF